jgi:hypothetical protein
MDDGARLLLTDSNRRAARRWNTVRENVGLTERAGEEPLEANAVDQRLPLFAGVGDDARTVVEQRGVRRVQASDYGNTVSYNTEDRPANAFDGDPSTAWRAGAYGSVIGQRLLVEALEPVTTDRVRVTQALTGARNRWITGVEVRLDGEAVGTFPLGDASRAEGGEELVLGSRTFTTLELVVTGDNVGGQDIDGLSAAGFSEVEVAGLRVDEVVRLPRTLLADPAVAGHDLTVLLSRARSDPRELYRADEEVALARAFDLPGPRSATVTGRARLSARADDEVLDAAVASGATGQDRPVARSSGRVAGNVGARASAAFDADLRTAWRPPFGDQSGRWVELDAGRPVTVERLSLELVTDGRASVPTRLRVEGDGVPVATLDVPPLLDEDEEGATSPVELALPAFEARTVRVVVEEVRVVQATDSFSEDPQTLPVGIAEVGLPVTVPAGRRRSTRAAGTTCSPSTTGPSPSASPAPPPTPPVARAWPSRGATLRWRSGPGSTSSAPPTAAPPASTSTSWSSTRRPPARRRPPRRPRRSSPSPTRAGRPTTSTWPRSGARSGSCWARATTSAGPPPPTAWATSGRRASWTATPTAGGSTRAARRPCGSPSTGPPSEPCGAGSWPPRSPPSPAWGSCSPAGAERWSGPWSGLGLRLPQLISPVAGVGERPAPATVAGITAATGVAGAVLVRWEVGPIVVLLTLAALLWRWGRLALTGGAIGLLGMSAGYVILKQLRNGYPPDFGWPDAFDAAHLWTSVALVLLLADVAVGWARRRTTIF